MKVMDVDMVDIEVEVIECVCKSVCECMVKWVSEWDILTDTEETGESLPSSGGPLASYG